MHPVSRLMFLLAWLAVGSVRVVSSAGCRAVGIAGRGPLVIDHLSGFCGAWGCLGLCISILMCYPRWARSRIKWCRGDPGTVLCLAHETVARSSAPPCSSRPVDSGIEGVGHLLPLPLVAIGRASTPPCGDFGGVLA